MRKGYKKEKGTSRDRRVPGDEIFYSKELSSSLSRSDQARWILAFEEASKSESPMVGLPDQDYNGSCHQKGASRMSFDKFTMHTLRTGGGGRDHPPHLCERACACASVFLVRLRMGKAGSRSGGEDAECKQ